MVGVDACEYEPGQLGPVLVPELGLGLALVVAAEVVDAVAFAGAAEKSKSISKNSFQVRYMSKYGISPKWIGSIIVNSQSYFQPNYLIRNVLLPGTMA